MTKEGGLDFFHANPDTRLLFEGVEINGIWIHPRLAYVEHDDWYSDLINRAIPDMGDYYMVAFIRAGFHPHRWLDLIKRESVAGEAK